MLYYINMMIYDNKISDNLNANKVETRDLESGVISVLQ